MVLMMQVDNYTVPWNEDNRMLQIVKSNRGKRGDVRRYRIERVHVGGVEDVVPRLVRSDGVPFGGAVNQP
jgi:hypothetical protein